MQIGKMLNQYYIMDGEHFVTSYGFDTIQALENHIKLMLIAVQRYNGVTLQEDDIVVDDYSAR